jgi:GH43 family beta-xylosidase
MDTNNYIRPLVEQRADPYIYKHSDGCYYFTASVPTYDYIELRRAKTIDALSSATTTKIWQRHGSGIMSEHIWAPEIHFLDGKWYIYFAAGEKDDIWRIRPYVLECSGSDPMTDPWIEKGMMQKADNDPYSFTDFSLDATVFEHNGRKYFVWAQKVGREKGISNLYIAEMESPVKLKTVQVLLSTPDYDWERVDFWVNEGPAIIKRNERIFITFSASATGACYCMGMLEASDKEDLLDPQVWKKSRYPVFATNKERNIYGPGHNSFTVSEDGEDLMIFHARPYEKIIGNPLYDYNRHTMVMKLKWNSDGTPCFSL